MKNMRLIIIIVLLLVIAAGAGFYYVTTHREAPDFKQGLLVPNGIAINEKQINDEVVTKTIAVEIQKATLEKATKKDMQADDNMKAFLLKGIYSSGPQSGQLSEILVMKDGTFVASKYISPSRLQYAKGRFSSYTMNYLTGLYTLQ